MPRPFNDSTYLYGLHDPGGEHLMLDCGLDGWVLVTVSIGHNPNDQSPGDETRYMADFRQLSRDRLGVIVRLNNGYGGAGTLAYERLYDDFARRCANFVGISRGCHIWIVGNETNHPIEWPGADWDWDAMPPRPRRPDSEGEKITPDRYVACYRKVRERIHTLPGHETDQVLVAGVAPWNNLLTYAGNPDGDWVQYFREVLEKLGPGNCDGVTLHAYTHGTEPALVTSDATVEDQRFSRYHWHFRAYRDFMEAIPESMRHLPVYLTETDQGDVAWRDENTGWVREAYREIDRWNRRGEQQIRALVLYRWPKHDKWYIEGKQGVIDDFVQSFEAGYQWQEGPSEPNLEELVKRYEALAAQVNTLQPGIDAAAQQTAQAQELERSVAGLADDAKRASDVHSQVDDLTRSVDQIEWAVRLLAGGYVPQPVINDVRDQLATHPSKHWPTRGLNTVQRVVLHHTATSTDITPQRVAEFHVQQGLPGIKYHYLISGDGTTHWTQPLEAVVEQTALPTANAEGIAIALAGNFTVSTPGEAQLDGAASLIAWLLSTFGLGTDAVVGRSELDSSDPTQSPGKQWLEGARYKDELLSQVQAILDAATKAPEEQIRQLQVRIRELESQVAELEAQASQIPTLEQEIRSLRQQVDQQQGEISRLAVENSQLLAENARLWAIIQNLQGGSVQRPSMIDVVESLPRHTTLRYENRTVPVSTVVVHHTDTRNDITVEQIAHYHVWGTRHDSNGNLVKGEWPGIGYHYVIVPDGTIYWTQRDETRSYHAANANNYSIGISLIGRFVGGPLPTEDQMRSASLLVAWLMQEHGITDVKQVVGHKEVSSTSCPGDQWMRGANWKSTLHQRIQSAAAPGGRPVEHCLLFWDHGDNWAQQDWQNAQGYIAHFRSMSTFSTDEALAAQHVVIVGGNAGVSGEDESRLRDAGCNVYRLDGANEAQTKAMLEALVEANTPWPGAPPRQAEAPVRSFADRVPPPPVDEPLTDEWTIPDDYEVPPEDVVLDRPTRVRVETFGPSQ